jgi:DNA uptake protein ComE-like DNA-binding protein
MSGSSQPKPGEWGWNYSQRRALLLLLSVLLVVLCIRFALNRQFVPTPQAPEGARAGELATRIDPNTADWQTLAAIPGLGEKRSKDIVAFRERMRGGNSGRPIFQRASDLRRIRGIGPATVANIEPYLIFPADSAATQP